MAGGGVGEAALAAEALGAAEVAGTAAGAGGFLEGMAGVSALEGAGVAGLGLGTGAGLTTGAGLAGGLGALSPAFQTALAETAVVNPEIAAQFAQAANAGAVPSASSILGAGQMGDPALIQAAQGAGNVASQGLQAGNFAQQIPAQYQTAMSQLAQGAGQYPGTQLASLGNAGVSDALARGVAGPGEAGWGMDLGAAEVPFTPGDPRAAIPPVEGMLDAATGRIPETPGIMNLLSRGYDAWKNSDPFIKYGSAGLAAAKYLGKPTAAYAPPGYSGPSSKFTYNPNTYTPYTYKPYAAGGPVEEMSERNQYETLMANGGQMYADGGMSHLGDYSDGGRLLRGPGDGVSDSIPAVIADKQPARLADGEFVVPARIVSELGNGSTEAGARKLYAMMDRVQKARGKTVGKDKAAVNTRADRLLPA